MSNWRFAVTEYLKQAVHKGLPEPPCSRSEFAGTLQTQSEKRWNICITPRMAKKHFPGYAGRYIRLLPVSQRRILRVNSQEVIFESKSTKLKTHIEERRAPAELVSLLCEHIPDRYQHSMRYFGLLEPRSKARTRDPLFCLLGQASPIKPRRERWQESLWRHFRSDPLQDVNGQQMKWVRSSPPSP
jgi:hypothetical protein